MTKKTYAPETVGAIMSTTVPTCRPNDRYKTILDIISSKSWESIHNVYVIDDDGKLAGILDMADVVQSDRHIEAKEIMDSPTAKLHPHDDQEKAVFVTVKDDLTAIPVVDDDGVFLGAIIPRSIINVMHTQHIEDALLSAGIRSGANGLKLATEGTGLVIKSRMPWLLFGLLAGLGLGVVSSWFEEALRHTVAIAYFIPVVAYIADSVGTQSEAIAVRALATLQINYAKYLVKELLVGFSLGAVVGLLGGAGAALIAHSVQVGIAVGLALLVASTVAAALASLIPIGFKLWGKDPALGSGPLATALQDLISVLIYFLFATLLI